jgi:murein endopeptidase
LRALVYSRLLGLRGKSAGALVLLLALPALAAARLGPWQASSDVAEARPADVARVVPASVPAEPAMDHAAVLPGLLVPPPRLSDADFSERFRSAPTQLGSLSLGRPNRGFLFNPAQLTDSAEIRVVNPKHAYGTEESVNALRQAVHEVNVRFPKTPRLAIGDLSDGDGGWISPHKSHQSGRDVDLGLYYADGSKWYTKATPQNLDADRSWALIVAMYRTGDLEYVFFDRSLHEPLREAAARDGTSPDIVECVFDGCPKAAGAILRHTRGHRTHMHVRFRSPHAVESAGRAQALSGKAGTRASGLLAKLKWNARQAERGLAAGAEPVRRVTVAKRVHAPANRGARAGTKPKSIARKPG